MALWRHRGDEQPVAGHISCGLTPGQLQRAVTQLTHLQIFRSDYPLQHYSRQINMIELTPSLPNVADLFYIATEFLLSVCRYGKY